MKNIATSLRLVQIPIFFRKSNIFYSDLESKGYKFIFQLDENGLTEEFLNGDYPFGYGSVYFYGKIDDDTQQITDIIAGYWQR